jgi:CRISPR/Cas system-associated exonuclease Cas4 (RecB family)
MTTFLKELADTIRQEYPQWNNLSMVFPNRRAALYFKNELKKNLTSAHWAPQIVTIEDFIAQFSNLQVADKFNLVMRLYKSYKVVNPNSEGIDKFYFWGEMLLRDFEELDKYLIDPQQLFREVTSLKEVEHYFDYLTDEQKQFLKDFWQTVEFSSDETKFRFLELWRSLLPVYQHFTQALTQEGVAYEGLLHRLVAHRIANEKPGFYPNQIVFAGFYALTKAEEQILSWFVQNQSARVVWDADAFYVDQEYREAGEFFRRYKHHPVLGKTFPDHFPTYFNPSQKITLCGVPQKAGQPKLLSQVLKDIPPEMEEATVIVLPEESMLLPVLHSLPSNLKAINVTMGYPLVNTPLYSFVDFIFELHLTKRKHQFYFRAVLDLLHHPYLKGMDGNVAANVETEINEGNRVLLNDDFFADRPVLISAIFKSVDMDQFVDYLLVLITEIAQLPNNNLFEKEFAFRFHRLITKLKDLSLTETLDLAMLQRLYRQMIRTEKVSFSGEPLKGVQIMGVLETRNLDFENVFVLSLNEGQWPAAPKHGSYIPYSVRKAYGLPTFQHQDALYAYLFYRLLQRTQRASLIYNTEPDVLGTGEMSRYLNQIIYDTGWVYEKVLLHSSVSIKPPQAILIPKDSAIMERLQGFKKGMITPSALNTYLECTLMFYFKHLAGLREPNKVEETADARVVGNFFHKVMELFYLDLKPQSDNWLIEQKQFENLYAKIDLLIERAYRNHFSIAAGHNIVYEGQQLVVNEVVKRMAVNVLEKDKAHTPFVIDVVEADNYKIDFDIADGLQVSLGGKIDRVDKKENHVRIIDYKTGSDENSFNSVASLFDRHNTKRNKAAFQAMMYAWVFVKKNKGNYQVQPGLLNRRDIFRSDFQYGLLLGQHLLTDVTALLPEFEEQLIKLLNEVYDIKAAFTQTENAATCEYCSFKDICGR